MTTDITEISKVETNGNVDKYRMLYDQHFEVEIGDVNSIDFKPHAKIKRWGEECYLGLSLPTTNCIRPTKEIDNISGINKGKLKWKDNDKEVHFYPLENGFEYEIILNKKPDSNIIELDIETNNLVFYYQPELTQEEINRGSKRPDNVVGSYAVYHATRSNMHTNQTDAEKYKTGKVGHIYRPEAIDAIGNRTWCGLNIVINPDNITGKLTITLPKLFVDNAIYPVRIDPDFGYTTIGGSLVPFSIMGGGSIQGSKFTGEAGTLNSMSVYLHDSAPGNPTWADLGGSQNFQVAIYQDSDNAYVDNIGDFAVSSNAFQTQIFPAVQQTISAVDYWLYVAYTDVGGFGDFVFAAFDAGGSYRLGDWVVIGGSWPGTLSSGDFNDSGSGQFSIYGTFTPSGGGGISVGWLTA